MSLAMLSSVARGKKDGGQKRDRNYLFFSDKAGPPKCFKF
jgi:hypothetical protein